MRDAKAKKKIHVTIKRNVYLFNYCKNDLFTLYVYTFLAKRGINARTLEFLTGYGDLTCDEHSAYHKKY